MTGNTGHIAAQKLLEQGKNVRVIGRSPEKLAALTALGAEPRLHVMNLLALRKDGEVPFLPTHVQEKGHAFAWPFHHLTRTPRTGSTGTGCKPRGGTAPLEL